VQFVDAHPARVRRMGYFFSKPAPFFACGIGRFVGRFAQFARVFAEALFSKKVRCLRLFWLVRGNGFESGTVLFCL